MSINLDDLDLPAGASASATATAVEPFGAAMNLDDIRQRVMADLPLTIEEKKALVHSIRRGYSSMVVTKVKATKSSDGGTTARRVAASATKGKLTSAQQLSALGGLDALDGV